MSIVDKSEARNFGTFGRFLLFREISDLPSEQDALLSLYTREQFVYEDSETAITGWQCLLLSTLAASENPFSLAVARGNVPKQMMNLAVSELEDIMALYHLDWTSLPATFDSLCEKTEIPGKRFIEAQTVANWKVVLPEYLKRMKFVEMMEAPDGFVAAEKLADAYRTYGVGKLNRYDAFVWDQFLRGVDTEKLDPITFEDLIGSESQKQALIENTEKLLRGFPSSNVLLYGDAGTGKSSSVKALLNRYRDQGLKLVSLDRERIRELPNLMEAISKSNQKYIIFIDDLSFEEGDTAYKSFKSVVEGGLRTKPQNVAIYVTSNRRNIVREVWKDREGSDEVHLRDNLQEKRSLSDRFGLTIVFLSPAKQEYLEIVFALAEKEGIAMATEELAQR
ncbi:MAG: ATP-binding protein, partial [Clostridiales Family XIII bacterium]|nr:ATP-binding protein [Clostridiales Family XIII bacterium]